MKTLIIVLISIAGIYACYRIIKAQVRDANSMPCEFGENHVDEEILKDYLRREKLRRMTKDIEDPQPGETKSDLNLDYTNIEGK